MIGKLEEKRYKLIDEIKKRLEKEFSLEVLRSVHRVFVDVSKYGANSWGRYSIGLRFRVRWDGYGRNFKARTIKWENIEDQKKLDAKLEQVREDIKYAKKMAQEKCDRELLEQNIIHKKSMLLRNEVIPLLAGYDVYGPLRGRLTACKHGIDFAINTIYPDGTLRVRIDFLGLTVDKLKTLLDVIS